MVMSLKTTVFFRCFILLRVAQHRHGALSREALSTPWETYIRRGLSD